MERKKESKSERKKVYRKEVSALGTTHTPKCQKKQKLNKSKVTRSASHSLSSLVFLFTW